MDWDHVKIEYSNSEWVNCEITLRLSIESISEIQIGNTIKVYFISVKLKCDICAWGDLPEGSQNVLHQMVKELYKSKS